MVEDTGGGEREAHDSFGGQPIELWVVPQVKVQVGSVFLDLFLGRRLLLHTHTESQRQRGTETETETQTETQTETETETETETQTQTQTLTHTHTHTHTLLRCVW